MEEMHIKISDNTFVYSTDPFCKCFFTGKEAVDFLEDWNSTSLNPEMVALKQAVILEEKEQTQFL